MVFQQYGLFLHLSVAQNVGFGLKVRRLPKAESETRVAEALRLVRLESFAARYPSQLSGGQKQRVALARAVVINPRVLLLDEPLGALDLKLREELQVEIKRVQQQLGITAIFVTHDQGEALTLSDRIAVMRDGRIVQIDRPSDLYDRPVSRYVASFVGRTNFLAATIADRSDAGDRYRVRALGVEFVVAGRQNRDFRLDEPVLLSFRPEDARFGAEYENRIPLRVTKRTFVGEGWVVSGTGPEGAEIVVRAPAGQPLPGEGTSVDLSWSPARTRILQDDV
jgi:ABC-type Fe3+/spermidine/putrescine transport system ATPase subunit